MKGLGQGLQTMPERGPTVGQADYQKPATPGAKPASPEQQAEYNKFVGFGMRLLFSDKVSMDSIEMLQKAGNKIEGAAQVLASIVTRLYTSQVEQGQQPMPEVVLHGSWELLDNVIQLAMASGMEDFSEDDREGAFFMAADLLRANLAKAGMIDPEIVKQDVAALHEMEDSGQMSEFAQHFAGQQQQGAPQEGEDMGA